MKLTPPVAGKNGHLDIFYVVSSRCKEYDSDISLVAIAQN